jgi:hypothetical protein
MPNLGVVQMNPQIQRKWLLAMVQTMLSPVVAAAGSTMAVVGMT